MIAMQYRFTLPADYDMDLIRRRIVTKGPLLDDLPDLVFKAYLYGERDLAGQGAGENRYAPFYLWANSTGMNAFLCGPAFQAVSQAFGWPSVQVWSVWEALRTASIAQAGSATQVSIPIAPHADLDVLRLAERDAARIDVLDHGAVAAVAAFEPTSWSLVRLRLWAGDGPPVLPEQQQYTVGHLSRPGVASMPLAPMPGE